MLQNFSSLCSVYALLSQHADGNPGELNMDPEVFDQKMSAAIFSRSKHRGEKFRDSY